MATLKNELEQMKKVLDEMNTHPDARFFYALQERGRIDENGTHCYPQMTIGIVTQKVSNGLYSNMAEFVDDMTMIFSDCPRDSALASGASTLRVLFSDLLEKNTNYIADHTTTPPGRKKRAPRTSRPNLDDFCGVEFDEFDEFSFYTSPEIFDIHAEEQAALLELSEEIATISAEIQLLKNSSDIGSDSESSHPGFSTHTEVDLFRTPAYSLGTTGLFASSAEEGRSALNTQQKRSRRNTPKSSATGLNSSSYNRRYKVTSSKYDLVFKEQLLHIITHDLPPKYLEGVIRIVNPSFDSATACDEDLEFDINSLDDDILERLQQYVYASIAPPKVSTVQQKRREAPKRKAKKEAPKSRLRNQRKRIAATQKKQQQQRQQLQLRNSNPKLKHSFIPAERISEIFKSEEIVRVRKSLDDEDEDVDIMA